MCSLPFMFPTKTLSEFLIYNIPATDTSISFPYDFNFPLKFSKKIQIMKLTMRFSPTSLYPSFCSLLKI
jgi:hypothetical protein